MVFIIFLNVIHIIKSKEYSAVSRTLPDSNKLIDLVKFIDKIADKPNCYI